MGQNINVDSINFNGLAFRPQWGIPLDNAFKINVGHTREKSKTETVKLDAWLLPFMNVYGLVGYTDGHSVSQIGVGLMAKNGHVFHPHRICKTSSLNSTLKALPMVSAPRWLAA
ncbi:Uncharacterised protein [Salmonella bongori]|nr:Uncharacterised protein [Salmonella bongori]